MKFLIQNLKPNKSGKVQLMPIGDLHVGSKNYLKDLAEQKVQYCLKNNVYVIGMGDMIEMADRNSPGSGVFEQSEPQQQIEEVIKLLEPLQEKQLLLGILRGNHERRANKSSGLDITSLMCKALQTKYLNGACNMLLRAGDVSYRVHATHGSASGGTMMGKLTGAKRVLNYIHCDLVLYAHTHGLYHDKSVYYEISKKRKTVELKYKHVVLTGSFLGYEGSYAEDKNLVPAMPGCPLISLDPNSFKIDVCLKNN